MIFLIDYDRKKGQLRDFRRFQDSQMPEARSERLRIELSEKDALVSGEREVVLLEADNEETLHRTHLRYFKSATEIMKSIIDEPA